MAGTPDVPDFGTKTIYTKSLKTIKFTMTGVTDDITGDVMTINAGPLDGGAPTVTKTGTITDGPNRVFQVDYGVTDFTQTERTTLKVQVYWNDGGTGDKTIGIGQYNIIPSVKS